MSDPCRHSSDLSGTYTICRNIPQLLRMTISVSAFLFLSSCHVLSCDEQPSVSGGPSESQRSHMDSAAVMDKVDPEVRALIDRIGDAGPATAAGTAASLSAFSTPSLRVDDRGRIQLHVYVSSVGEDMHELLGEAGAEIELENHELKVYQAWVPATSVRSIAAADIVRKITPPSYASYR